MTEVLHVNGSTTHERHGVIAAVDALLQACGASVTDYAQFSDVSANVSFEIAAGKLRLFETLLNEAGIWLTRDSLDDVARFSEGDLQCLLMGTVQVTFFGPAPERERVHSRGTVRLQW
ncbi:MAG: hypothetical protein SGI92_29960 [Bryobacteraceae bacterium]|nr:hypothetical protein [Bryobacteraceae bacterium]